LEYRSYPTTFTVLTSRTVPLSPSCVVTLIGCVGSSKPCCHSAGAVKARDIAQTPVENRAKQAFARAAIGCMGGQRGRRRGGAAAEPPRVEGPATKRSSARLRPRTRLFPAHVRVARYYALPIPCVRVCVGHPWRTDYFISRIVVDPQDMMSATP